MWKFWRQIGKLSVGFVSLGEDGKWPYSNCFPLTPLICLQVTSCTEEMPGKYSERKNACAGCLCLHPVQLSACAAKKFEQMLFAWQNLLTNASDVILNHRGQSSKFKIIQNNDRSEQNCVIYGGHAYGNTVIPDDGMG